MRRGLQRCACFEWMACLTCVFLILVAGWNGPALAALSDDRPTTPEVNSDASPLYVCDLHDHYLDHHEYCRIFSNPGEWCVRFGPPPEGKTFDDLIYDFDVLTFAATLQGVVNKRGARLYLIHDGQHVSGGSVDRFWLDRFSDGTKPYGWLADRPVVTVNGLDGLLDTFASEVAGAVLWDTEVPATLNVATTIAGVEDLVVVRDGSPIQQQITARIPVRQSLAGKFLPGARTLPESETASTGSPKNDAYLWAKEKYLDTGKADSTLLAYFEDGWPVQLYRQGKMTRKGTYAFERDFAVRNKAFVFDVSPFETASGSQAGETPIDDMNQKPGTDRATFRSILQSARSQAGRRMIRVWGFVPWYQKYTSAYESGGSHTDVESEWESSWLFSSHGAFLEGGGGDVNGIALANMSLHQQAPFPDRIPQNPPPTRQQLIDRGLLSSDGKVAARTYLMYYAGDYDLAHNVYGHTNEIERSLRTPPERHVPLAWGLNPGLIRVIPGILEYWMTERSTNDYFVGPNSGAGYLNPGALPDTLIPAWIAHTQFYYRRLGYSIQGWTLNGKGGRLPAKKADMFLQMGGDGVSFYPSDLEGSWPRLEQGVPIVAMAIPGLPWTVDEAAPVIRQGYQRYVDERGSGPRFLIGRLTCCSREEYWELTQRIKAEDSAQADYEVVDPYTFFYLLKVHLGLPIEGRASYLSDTIPRSAPAGSRPTVEISIRNDGWETWAGDGSYQLGVAISEGALPPGALAVRPGAYPIRLSLTESIPPGGVVTFRSELPIPSQPGRYTLQYDMSGPGGRTFEQGHDLPWQRLLVVE